MLQLGVDWGSQWCDWCSLYYIQCWDETTASTWTTFDGGCFAIFLVCAWTTKACDPYGWLSASLECHASISGRIVQWNAFIFHRWGTYIRHIKVPHYDRPSDDHAEWKWHQQHDQNHLSQYQMVDTDGVWKELGLNISDVWYHQRIFVLICPT